MLASYAPKPLTPEQERQMAAIHDKVRDALARGWPHTVISKVLTPNQNFVRRLLEAQQRFQDETIALAFSNLHLLDGPSPTHPHSIRKLLDHGNPNQFGTDRRQPRRNAAAVRRSHGTVDAEADKLFD